MGNSNNKSSLRKSQSVPNTQNLALDAPVFDKQKSVSQLRLNQTHEKPGKSGKKHKQKNEEVPQLPPAEATFLPEFPLRGDLEELDFDIIDVIARGAYGNVIKVHREDEKKFYAVKVLDKGQIIQEGAIRQCKDEATIQAMAGEHPLVVKAYEYWQSRRSLYIVLDYVPHGDMFTLWTFHGAFPENLVQLYIAEMAMVIDFLHNASVIYRDIKMENILFNAKGHIQLTDFGLAKWLQGGDQTRTVCGTLQYMAPEVLSVYPYSHSADWWSLGILMYAMLAGRYPVDGVDTHTKMAQKVFECDFLLPSHISDSAQDVINRVLTKSPHKRLCDVNSLQDLDFFQGIFFSDLIEQKLNPLDVVPEDFFPMSGHSWAPHSITDEEQRDFDQFDDSGDTLTDEPQYPHLHHYHAQPPASHHHLDANYRQQPSQPYSQHLVNEKPFSLPTEQQLQPGQQQHHLHQTYSNQSSQFSQDHKKPSPDFRGATSSHDTDLNIANARNPSVTNDRKHEQSSDYHVLHAGNSGDRQNNIPRLGYDGGSNILPQKSVDESNKEMRSNITSVRQSYGGSGSTNNESIIRSNTSSDRRSCGGGLADMNNESIIRSNTNPDRRSYGGGENITSSAVTKDNPGFVSVSSTIRGNNSNVHGSTGNINRQSSCPEYKSVEAPPTVTLKTLASVNSTQPRYNEVQPANSSQMSMVNPAPSSQNFVMNKQTVGINSPPEEVNYQTPAYDTRVSSHTAGFSASGNIRPTDKGYKTFEVSPTITLPSQQISFNQNTGKPNDRDLQRPQPTGNSFPNHFLSNSTNLPHTSSDYQRLDQRTITLNSAPQTYIAPQRPNVPAKPVPAQKPALVSKPAAPVRPIPAPRRSLRQNQRSVHPNPEPWVTSQQGLSISPFNKDPYASNISQGQYISPYSQNTSSTNDPLNQQQDWKNTPHQQTQSVTAAEQGRTGSGNSISMLTSSEYTGLDTATKSPSIENQNFQWKLPAGTTPSFV